MDALKAGYTAWKILQISAFELGRDPRSGTIDTSEEWCRENIRYIGISIFFVTSVFYTNRCKVKIIIRVHLTA